MNQGGSLGTEIQDESAVGAEGSCSDDRDVLGNTVDRQLLKFDRDRIEEVVCGALGLPQGVRVEKIESEPREQASCGDVKDYLSEYA